MKRVYAADLIRGTIQNGSIHIKVEAVDDDGAIVRFKEEGPTYRIADGYISEWMQQNMNGGWSQVRVTSNGIEHAREEHSMDTSDIDPRLLRALLKAHATRLAFEEETGVELDMVTWKLGGTLYLGNDPDIDL